MSQVEQDPLKLQVDRTQAIRDRIVNHYTASDDSLKSVLDDPKLAPVLLKALKDSDASALTQMRIKSDENIAADQARIARENAMMLDMLESSTGNPFRRVAGNNRPALDGEVDRSQLPKLEKVDGQMEIDAPTESYEEFTKRVAPMVEEAIKAGKM